MAKSKTSGAGLKLQKSNSNLSEKEEKPYEPPAEIEVR